MTDLLLHSEGSLTHIHIYVWVLWYGRGGGEALSPCAVWSFIFFISSSHQPMILMSFPPSSGSCCPPQALSLLTLYADSLSPSLFCSEIQWYFGWVWALSDFMSVYCPITCLWDFVIWKFMFYSSGSFSCPFLVIFVTSVFYFVLFSSWNNDKVLVVHGIVCVCVCLIFSVSRLSSIFFPCRGNP